MFAVYIDPLVCKTWAGWIIPECWGIAVLGWTALTCAIVSAVARKRVRA